MPDTRVDLLVLGGGMAGLSAAARAAELGAVAGVVEKGVEIGGSAALSAGQLWSGRSYEELRERIPHGRQDLLRVLAAGFPGAMDAVLATGVEASAPIDGPYFGFGAGRQVDVVGLFRLWVGVVEAKGGWVVRETAGRRLLRDGSRVLGAAVSGPDGETEVHARAVLLATGGFQGDPALLAAFVGPRADRALRRSNPGSVGDGLRLALEVGAGTSGSLGSFYGHLLPYPLPDFGERHFLPLTQYHSIHSLLLNRHARRFVDESRGDEVSNQALLAQPDARAVLVADEETRRRYVVTRPYPGGELADRFADAEAAGANYARADTIAGLSKLVAAWGIPAAGIGATIDAYRRAAAGENVALDAPLPATPATLDTAPFHALEVQPAITFTYGGIRVDGALRVLTRDGVVVQGLYAAGADAGGLFDVTYGGGLGAALVLGRAAADAALR